MTDLHPGDRVYVTDPGLDRLRQIMREATGEDPPPNHTGTVEAIWPDGVLIIFDDTGSAAPYPFDDVYRIEP